MRVLAVSASSLGLAVVLTASLASGVSAQAGRSQVREGNRLYGDGRFDEAHQKYLEGLAAAPGSGVIRFNDGNALYRDEDYQRAAEAYRRAIETGDPALESQAWYNLGNALYREQQLEESLEAFKQSLRLNPGDADAKHNLERVLEQMQEQQQQQQQQDPQNQDQQQDSRDQQGDQDQQQPQGQEPQSQQNQDQQPQQGDPQAEQPQGGQPQEGQMSREEAERLLDAVNENPEDVNRKRAPATGRRPQRPW